MGVAFEGELPIERESEGDMSGGEGWGVWKRLE